MKQMISNAIVFATNAHNGQFDRGGMPYILHCLKVMHYLKTEDEELMAIAVLHDVLEDCYDDHAQGISDLVEIGMSNRVITGVRTLTKTKNVAYDDYIHNISLNKDATMVKMADLRHNMDIRRLKGIGKKDIDRLEKYAKAFSILKTSVNN